MFGTSISLEMTSWLNRASSAWRQLHDVESFPCMYNPLQFGWQQVWYGISTHSNVKLVIGCLPSIWIWKPRHIWHSLVRAFPLRRLFAFQVLSGEQQANWSSGKLLRSCPAYFYAGRVTISLKPLMHANNVALTYNSSLLKGLFER
jgi:hypothetical protein